MTTLVEDIRAVIDHVDATSATVVGHDWGGAIAWMLAMFHPDRVNRLIVLTILTLPEAGHFVQHDSAEAVTTTMVSWLHATAASSAHS